MILAFLCLMVNPLKGNPHTRTWVYGYGKLFFFFMLRFITNTKSLTHHYILYDLVGWTALAIRRKQHWYIFIYKSNAR